MENMEKKWKLKNLEKITQFNKYIDDNHKNIFQILVSPEMYEYLKLLDSVEIFENGMFKYKNKLVVRMDYFPAHGVNFVFKDKYINFILPCVCGIYPDEQHP